MYSFLPPLLPCKEFGQPCNLGLVFLIHLSSVAVIWHGIIFFQSFFKVRILGYFLNSLGEFVYNCRIRALGKFDFIVLGRNDIVSLFFQSREFFHTRAAFFRADTQHNKVAVLNIILDIHVIDSQKIHLIPHERC